MCVCVCAHCDFSAYGREPTAPEAGLRTLKAATPTTNFWEMWRSCFVLSVNCRSLKVEPVHQKKDTTVLLGAAISQKSCDESFNVHVNTC